ARGMMNKIFSQISSHIAQQAGKPWVFVAAALTIVIWGITGPFFGFSNTWQLIINTGTTIVTFLMVFVIQNSQNRDGAALQTKIDELIRATQEARNDLVGIERKAEEKVEQVREEIVVEASTSQNG